MGESNTKTSAIHLYSLISDRVHFHTMPHIFTFGLPSYFNFTFRAGPRSPGLANETVHVDLDSKNNTDPDANYNFKAPTASPLKDTYPNVRNGVGVLVSSPFSGTTSSSCGTLGKIPLEIRIMVYKKVLCVKRDIKHAHKFLDHYPPIMANQGTHLEVIDAALLPAVPFTRRLFTLCMVRTALISTHRKTSRYPTSSFEVRGTQTRTWNLIDESDMTAINKLSVK